MPIRFTSAAKNLDQFFHLSPTKYSVGDEIQGNGRDKVDPRIEDALEERRPQGLLPRRGVVFGLEKMDFSVCGIFDPGFIYRIAPKSELQRCDIAWVGEMQKAVLKMKYPKIEAMKEYPEWNDELIEQCCVGYWSGEAMQEPCWEFLFRSCTVVEVISSDLVDPKSTNGGWRP